MTTIKLCPECGQSMELVTLWPNPEQAWACWYCPIIIPCNSKEVSELKDKEV